MLRLFAAVSILCFSGLSFAQTTAADLSVLQKPASDGTTLKTSLDEAGVETKNYDFRGFLRMEGMFYSSPLPDQPELSQTLLVSGNVHFDHHSGRLQNQVDATVGKFVNMSGTTIAVNALYSSMQFDNKTVTLGRRIESWSQVDQDWNLGLWQPNAAYDSLRPITQGLTGLFFKQKNEKHSILAFFSPIFIPTMGPEIKEKDGSLKSDSRWYRTPGSTFPVLNNDTQLVYDLDVPDLMKLISKPGVGLRYRWGDQKGMWASANAAYKPINALLLTYKAGLYLPETDPATGEVTIRPHVGYHALAGADVGYTWEQSTLAFSALADRPDKELPEEDGWVLQQPEPMQAVGVHFDSQVDVGYFSNPIRYSLNYLKVFGAQIHDYDAYAVERGAVFENRTNFTNAAQVAISFDTAVWNRRWTSSFKYLREFDQQGSLINGEINYYPTREIAVVVGADVLGVDSQTASEGDSRFLNQFRANDRVYGGLSYVY